MSNYDPSARVPAPARPIYGSLTALHQDTPLGLLDIDARQKVIGFLALNPEWDGVICLTGEVSHWVQISADEIVSFQSFLTGRIAEALSAIEAADTRAIEATLARPERLATHLRSAELGQTSGAALGHLIGAELAAARAFWLGQNIAVIGDSLMAQTYANALRHQGSPVIEADADAMSKHGETARQR